MAGMMLIFTEFVRLSTRDSNDSGFLMVPPIASNVFFSINYNNLYTISCSLHHITNVCFKKIIHVPTLSIVIVLHVCVNVRVVITACLPGVHL